MSSKAQKKALAARKVAVSRGNVMKVAPLARNLSWVSRSRKK